MEGDEGFHRVLARGDTAENDGYGTLHVKDPTDVSRKEVNISEK